MRRRAERVCVTQVGAAAAHGLEELDKLPELARLEGEEEGEEAEGACGRRMWECGVRDVGVAGCVLAGGGG